MRAVGHLSEATKTLCALGEVAWVLEEYDQAAQHYTEALTISRPMDYQPAIGAARDPWGIPRFTSDSASLHTALPTCC